MRIVVTGRGGQVARALSERGASIGQRVITLARPELDLAGDLTAIIDTIKAADPDVVISAAAYTAVDRAEGEGALATAVNVAGAQAVAVAVNKLGVPLIHLSTDYVFDGTKDGPYSETDATGPTGVYGRTKLAGELAVLDAHDDATVLRTAWVYSPFGANFVKTMLRLAAEQDELGVVSDQYGNPTSALDIADAIFAISSNLVTSGSPDLRGIFHMSGSGGASWADFAEEIFAVSASAGGPSARVRRIVTSEFPTPAKRPSNSRLDCSKLLRAHGVSLPDWRTSTATVVSRLLGSDQTQLGKMER